VRCGTFKVPYPGEGEGGLSPWEYTIAELLSDAGYATSLWGKWHLGEVEGRLPTDQGFDEWWGYKNSVDEAGYASYAAFRELIRARGLESPKIWEGKRGQKSTAVRELDLEVRPFLDELIVGKATDYIKRAAKDDKPFFTYVGLSNLHPPAQVHPDFNQTDPSRLGMYADFMAEMDHRLGQIVDCVDAAGIGRDDQRRPSSGRIERPFPRRVLYPAVGGLDAGPGHSSLSRQSAGGHGNRRDALGP
jgi:arylsulfatase